MARQGVVKVDVAHAPTIAGAQSNVAVATAEKDEQRAMSVDGKKIAPQEVWTDTVRLRTALTVGNGVTLTDGCVSANHIATDAVTATHINASGLTATDISFTGSLSGFGIANLGAITTGSIAVGSGGVTITNDGGSSGIHIGANQIYSKYDGVTTFMMNGVTGETSARKFTLIADAGNSVDLSLGTHILATSITVGAQTLGDIQTNATTGAGKSTTFAQTSIPTAVTAGDLWCDTDDGNKLYRAAAAGANEIKAGEWVLVQDTAYTSKNVTFAQTSVPTSLAAGDLWIDTDDSNKTYRAASAGADEIKAGEWVLVRDAGATAGGTAVQPGNGFGVNASNQPSTISLDSSGISIYTAASGARLLLNNAGLSAKANFSGTAKDVVTLDSTSGIQIINHSLTAGVTERLSLAYETGGTTTEKGYIFADASWLYITNTVAGTGVIQLSAADGVDVVGRLVTSSTIQAVSHFTGSATMYNASNVAFSMTRIKLGDATRYVHFYTWATGDPTTFRLTSGGAQGTWGSAGDLGVSMGGSFWIKGASVWSRIYGADTAAATAHP